MIKSVGKILIRIVLVSLYAMLVMKLVGFAMPDDIEFTSHIPKKLFLFFYLFFFNLNTEGSLFFDRLLNKKIPWFYFPKKRLLVQLALILLWALLTIGLPFTVWYFINGQSLAYPPASVIIFIGSVVFMFGFIGIAMIISFFKQWKSSMLKAEYYKQEKLKADYKVLQNQVNPHFLFNSLNVLISEIRHNPKTAETFTRKLSKVYRYVLQSKNHDLILLEKEVEFIRSFIYLHQVRVGDALKVSINVDSEAMQMRVPPLILQILVENTIKHNIINEEEPLSLTIETISNSILIVRNSLNLKQSFQSTKTGLSNIKNRYKLLNKKGFKIEKKETEFIVTVPLIDE